MIEALRPLGGSASPCWPGSVGLESRALDFGMRSGLSVTTLRTLAKFLQVGQSTSWHKAKEKGPLGPVLEKAL